MTARMSFAICLFAICQSVMAETPKFAADDWPWWRGVSRDNTATLGQSPPAVWSETENVAWKAALPGRGHGSPTLLGNQVFLATADHKREAQLVLCFDRQTGKPLWERVVHQGGFANKSKRKANKLASLASATIATDGERLFINFLNDNAVHLTALNLDGEIIWQKRVCDYLLHQGYGSSPAIYENLVIVAADNRGGGAVVAFDRVTGQEIWRRSRPKEPNYPSPSILRVAGRDQLILTGCFLITSLDPLTGEQLWETAGSTGETVTTTVTDGTHVFSSGGYPRDHLSAIDASDGEVVWETRTRIYVPSMCYRDGYLYATLDAGVAMCIRSADGKQMWKARLGGTFTSSSVLVGDHVYAFNQEGVATVFRADPAGFEKLSENTLGENNFATPVIAGSRIYTRVAFFEDGERREYLYCLGE